MDAGSDQLQGGQGSHASPVLFDAGCQTVISVHNSWCDRYFAIDAAGHASPVLDGDTAAGSAE
eukprot:3709186-Karenia_brevis.AAC.1